MAASRVGAHEWHKQRVDVTAEDQAYVAYDFVANREQNLCMEEFKAQLEVLSEAFTQQRAELSELKKRMTFVGTVFDKIHGNILKGTDAVARMPEVQRQVKAVEKVVLTTVDRIVQEVASLNERVQKAEVGRLQTPSITEETLSVKAMQPYTDVASTASGSFSRQESIDEEDESLAETANKITHQWMSFGKDAQLHSHVSSIASGSFGRQESTDEEDESLVDTAELRAAIDSLIKPVPQLVRQAEKNALLESGSGLLKVLSVSDSTNPIDHTADVKGLLGTRLASSPSPVKPPVSSSIRSRTQKHMVPETIGQATNRCQFGQATRGSGARAFSTPVVPLAQKNTISESGQKGRWPPILGANSAYPQTVRGQPLTLTPRKATHSFTPPHAY